VTPRQAQLIRESFENVRDVAGPLAQLFYGRLFSLEPDTRALFHSDIQRQGEKLMAMLARVVDSADNLDALRPRLRELGRKHLEYGATSAHYDAVGYALVWSLGRALEREFGPELKQAWSDLVAAVNEEMKRGAAEA